MTETPTAAEDDALVARLAASAEWLRDGNVSDMSERIAAELDEAADRIAALTAERDTFYMDYRMKCDAAQKQAEAALAAETERCAKVCEDCMAVYYRTPEQRRTDHDKACEMCATAIRAGDKT